jgi:hypothetical protein
VQRFIHVDWLCGCVLLNASGQFENSAPEEKLKASMYGTVLCNVSVPTFLTEPACIYQHVEFICLVWLLVALVNLKLRELNINLDAPY